MYRVYVIENGSGRRYIGLSDDVDRRVEQHNEGVSKWTRCRGPWVLVWTGEEMTLSEARRLENRLKRQGRGTGFQHITGLPRSSGS